MNTGTEVLHCNFELLAASNLLSVFEPGNFEWGCAFKFTLKDNISALKGVYRAGLLAKNRRLYNERVMRIQN